MNNSIAVWWSNEKSTVNVDVNVFISKEKEKNYIEFGIKVKNDIKTPNHFVCVYLPYEISERHIDDKTPYLISNINLTKVLFNENISIETDNPNVTIVKFKDGITDTYLTAEKNFRFMGINDSYEIKLVKDNHKVIGSYIKININNNHSSKIYNALYYRFRINKLDKIIKDVNENYFLIDGLIKKVIFFDFNLNKQDKLPLIILKNFESYNFNVQKVNVFLKTDMSTNIIFQSKTHKNIKVLAEIWRDYIGVNDKNDDILVYHWKDKEIFAKLNYINKSFKFYILLLGTIIIINILSNFAFEFVKGLIK